MHFFFILSLRIKAFISYGFSEQSKKLPLGIGGMVVRDNYCPRLSASGNSFLETLHYLVTTDLIVPKTV